LVNLYSSKRARLAMHNICIDLSSLPFGVPHQVLNFLDNIKKERCDDELLGFTRLLAHEATSFGEGSREMGTNGFNRILILTISIILSQKVMK
jgi:hypothetical protein